MKSNSLVNSVRRVGDAFCFRAKREQIFQRKNISEITKGQSVGRFVLTGVASGDELSQKSEENVKM